jgi:hypothetical protein
VRGASRAVSEISKLVLAGLCHTSKSKIRVEGERERLYLPFFALDSLHDLTIAKLKQNDFVFDD